MLSEWWHPDPLANGGSFLWTVINVPAYVMAAFASATVRRLKPSRQHIAVQLCVSLLIVWVVGWLATLLFAYFAGWADIGRQPMEPSMRPNFPPPENGGKP
jgi:hypothetical protein